MNEPRLSERELLILIEGACDATLSQADFNRLARALRDDSSAAESSIVIICRWTLNYYWRQIGPRIRFHGAKRIKTDSQWLPIVSLSLGRQPGV